MEVLCLVIASALSVYFAYFAAKLVWGSYAFNDISQNVDATPLWIPQLSMAIGLAGLALAFIEQLVITVRTRRLPTAVNEAAHIE
jgi:TRAP-type C4-dicarboxylate transport system permease small subunit